MPLDDTLVAQLPDTLTVDMDGKSVPIREHPFVKEAKDFPSFVKGAVDAHREVGSRIPIKGDWSKPEEVKKWRETNLLTLYKNGLLQQPPASPKDYGVVKPTELPDGLVWDDARAEKFANVLHKYGVPKEIVPELMELNKEALLGQTEVLKTSVDEGMKALKAEYGDKFDERAEAAKRLTSFIFKNPDEVEFFEKLGLGNHPGFLSVIMRLAPLAASDSSLAAAMQNGVGGGSQMSAEEVRSEMSRIMSDPTHPDHKGYWLKDPKVMAKVDEMYKKAYPGQATL